MTEERVLVALHAGPDLVSLSVSIGDDDAELGDLVADDNAEVPFEMAALSLARNDLQDLLDYLNPREREILSLRFGLEGDQPLTLDEVGRRFNVTRERIRQIEAKALTKLRHPCSARHRRLVASLGSLAPPSVRPTGATRRRARATIAPLASCCRSGSSSAGNHATSTISGDAATAPSRVDPGGGPGPEDDVDALRGGVDHHRRVAEQLDVEGRLLLHLAAGRLLRGLAPLEEAARAGPSCCGS